MKKIRNFLVLVTTLCMLTSVCWAKTADDFKDLQKGRWYISGINYVLQQGYMSGTSKDTFSPQQYVTRAQVAQVIYAREGKPETDGGVYQDVPQNKWYTKAVSYMISNEWMNYPEQTKFGYWCPDDTITRAELMDVLYEVYAYRTDMDYTYDPDVYMSVENIVDYDYQRPFAWAVTNKIICGTDKGLEPDGLVTRAQFATILKALDSIPEYYETLIESEGEEEYTAYLDDEYYYEWKDECFGDSNIDARHLNAYCSGERAITYTCIVPKSENVKIVPKDSSEVDFYVDGVSLTGTNIEELIFNSNGTIDLKGNNMSFNMMKVDVDTYDNGYLKFSDNGENHVVIKITGKDIEYYCGTEKNVSYSFFDDDTKENKKSIKSKIIE